MGWYLYTGNVVRAIQTGYDNTVAVPPYGRVEIHQLGQATQAMLRAKPPLLRPCGAPAGVTASPHAAQVPAPAAVLEGTKFAGYFQEPGVVTDPAAIPAPVVPVVPKNVSAPEAGASVGEELPPVDEAGADADEPSIDVEAPAPARKRR
jgi:hypothetical protein